MPLVQQNSTGQPWNKSGHDGFRGNEYFAYPANWYAGLNRTAVDLGRPSTCPDRGPTRAWITGTSPVMTTNSKGVAIRGTGQPWLVPAGPGELNKPRRGR